ncbi:hypothetical protein KSC_014620 [Ktedonobacter sp. SOSP1-52]|nr:hypothetical protein KSC_014620 [Ktedonobacter sp. SOSP1-52]
MTLSTVIVQTTPESLPSIPGCSVLRMRVELSKGIDKISEMFPALRTLKLRIELRR